MPAVLLLYKKVLCRRRLYIPQVYYEDMSDSSDYEDTGEGTYDGCMSVSELRSKGVRTYL